MNTIQHEHSLQPRRFNPALLWALIGMIFMSFELYVWGTWVGSPNFHRPQVDVDSVSALTRTVIHITEIISPIITLSIMLKFLVIPWWRERRLGTDGMLVIAWFFLWFQDPMGNIVSNQLYYSSYWVSMGSWTLGSFPGWISPAGNHLPEPILVMGFGYLWLGFSAGVAACWAMGKVQKRFPRVSGVELAAVALLLCLVLDIAAEVALSAAGTFAWPCAIKGLSLFPGKPWQFPMYEGVLFGGTIAAGGCLRYFRDDKGQTWVERGLDRTNLSPRIRNGLKFFAIFGFMHLFMATVYSVPMNWFGMHSDTCLRYPSHLENGMCIVGPNHDQCPGPGIAMPKPPY